ncbi:DUF6894 family protein [Brevundimonas goettingensis]|uniref:DUF6894 domain-containing protein n=1 Tax=Brevundimonas goettingensis TaxID=2774190 RepID=A0A975GV87_9CAUL|nr:hypothetical protein [Brevundimonas goettingensis]QTC90279.1 hypothetical protein IFJ75_13455 [Brevundimonas goettingensis]
MPRYFFDTQDGRCVRDPEGAELPDAQAAKREGLSILGEILRYQGEEFWKTAHFSVIVTNAAGERIVTLTANAIEDIDDRTIGAPHEPAD